MTQQILKLTCSTFLLFPRFFFLALFLCYTSFIKYPFHSTVFVKSLRRTIHKVTRFQEPMINRLPPCLDGANCRAKAQSSVRSEISFSSCAIVLQLPVVFNNSWDRLYLLQRRNYFAISTKIHIK